MLGGGVAAARGDGVDGSRVPVSVPIYDVRVIGPARYGRRDERDVVGDVLSVLDLDEGDAIAGAIGELEEAVVELNRVIALLEGNGVESKAKAGASA